MKNEGAIFLLALQFLTRVPVRTNQIYTADRMAASVRYYPLVGMLVGGVCAAFYYAAQAVLPHTLGVLIAMAAGVLMTGAFHEDGLADTVDGVGGGLTRERALEIMKDPRLGAYGAVVLIMALSIKAGAVIALSPALIPIALVAGHGLSRLSSVLVIATSRYVREHGTGKPVAGGISPFSLLVACGVGGMVLLAWCVWYEPLALGCALGGLLVGHCLMRLFFEPKLGGYTGDTLGAVQQASEVGFYLGLVAWL